MDFNNIIGQEDSIKILKRAIKNKQISHSYLFEGEEGIGKKLVAKVFAKTLLCKEEGTDPCNKCSSCLKVDAGVHPDLIIIKPDGSMIKKQQVDDMIKDASKVPFESKRKVFIIDDSHTMNVESKNAILKTLEEPASFVNIILISSNPNNLLPTILSRVENIKFYPIKQEDIINLLTKKYNKNLDEAKFIANFTKGAIGKSILIAEDEEFFKNRDIALNIIDGLVKNDLTKAFSSYEFFNDNKEIIEDYLDLYTYWFRDLIIYKELGESNLIINRDKLDLLSDQSYMKFDRINDIIEFIQDTKLSIKRNVNYQLAIEVMLLNIGGV